MRGRWLFGSLAVVAFGVTLLGANTVSAADMRGHAAARAGCLRAFLAGDRVNSTLDALVSEGTITDQQEQAIQQRLGEGIAGDRPCARAGIVQDGPVAQAVRDLLGMDKGEIRQDFKNGQSLTEIAASKGISRDELIQTIDTAIEARLQTAVEQGRITDAQKTSILTALEPRVESAVDYHRGDDRAVPGSSGTGTPAAPSTPVSTTIQVSLA